MYLYKNIIKKLIGNKITLSVAESCTGGQLSKFFTDFPGISEIFNMGLITYSNDSKVKILNISKNKIIKYGAVSKEIAILMAKQLFAISKSKLCISTSGIAGPSGGNVDKPVGLVFICIIYKKKIYIYKKKFSGNRKKIQKDTVIFCINQINDLI